MNKTVLVPIADGTEEIEAVCIVDVLRRAGADVTVASVDGLEITASRGVRILADKMIDQCLNETYDLIALPGGMPGAEHLRDSSTLTSILTKHGGQGRMYAAICAAPAVALQAHGMTSGRRATAHPAFDHLLEDRTDVDRRVVVDQNLVTSRGPGTAIEFALKLVELLYGPEKADEVAEPMLVPRD